VSFPSLVFGSDEHGTGPHRRGHHPKVVSPVESSLGYCG
jgi:hypothetical protein